MLAKYPKAKIKVFVMWVPFMQRDSQSTAQRASVYMPDRRVRHFWDLWRYSARTLATQLNIPVGDAWDMFAFYEPRLAWEDGLPEPTMWMQNRKLKVGIPYSQAALEEELKTWLE